MADVLVVEDEPDIRQLVVHHLERDGFRCRQVATGPEALRAVRASTPDLIVLDLMLPGLDGLEVCRRLRADTATASIPIIMLTAKTDEVDRVVGLELGADDYVAKPFSPKELVARVRAVLRRARPGTPGRVLREGAIVLDPARHLVTVGGAAVNLTPKEFDLLVFMMQHAGKVLTHRSLLSAVWGGNYVEQNEYLRVFIGQLRKKIEPDPASPRYILTEPWIGYRFDPGQ
jgi:DNA-binding response OmpR family regulator